MPNYILDGLQWIEKPHERCIWSTAKKFKNIKIKDRLSITKKIDILLYYTDFGLSSGSGSFLPKPAGFFSASSFVSKCISASTLPCNEIINHNFL